jgi:hypothetical protein
MTLTRGELEYLLLLATREQRRVHNAPEIGHTRLFAHCPNVDCQFIHTLQDAVDGLPRRRKHQMMAIEVA